MKISDFHKITDFHMKWPIFNKNHNENETGNQTKNQTENRNENQTLHEIRWIS